MSNSNVDVTAAHYTTILALNCVSFNEYWCSPDLQGILFASRNGMAIFCHEHELVHSNEMEPQCAKGH